MRKIRIELVIIFIVISFLTSCASSMTPAEVSSTLPTLTESTFYNQIIGKEAVKNNKCKVLVKGRKYAAPMGFTVKDDLKNGAIGIDEWVKSDGGNAYVLVNYKWVTVDHTGGTQLHIDFDTMHCN